MDIAHAGRRLAVVAVAGLLLTVPLAYTTGIFDYTLLPKRLTFFVWCLLALAGCTLASLKEKTTIPLEPAVAAILAYGVLALLSAIGVTNPVVAVYELSFTLALCGLFLLGTQARSTDVEIWALTIAAISGFVSIVGVLQYFGIAFLGIPSNGQPSAFFGYRNFAAMFLVCSIPLGVATFLAARHPLTITLSGLSTLLGTLFLLYTRTRGAWLGVAAGVACSAVLVTILPSARANILEAVGRRSRLKLAVVAVSVALLAGTATMPAGFTDRGLQRFDEKKSDLVTTIVSIGWESGDRGRRTMWERSLPMIWDHLLGGVGPGHWAFVYPKYDQGNMIQPNSSPKRPHNDYVWIAAENGLPALLAFFAFLVAVAITCIRSLRSGQDASLMTLGMMAAVLGVSVHACFSFPKEQPQAIAMLFLFAGVIVGGSGSNRRRVPIAPITGFATVCALAGAVLTWQHLTFDRHFLAAMDAEDRQEWSYMQNQAEEGLSYGSFRPHLEVILGRAHERQGRFDEAESAYRSVIERAPYSWHAYNGIGVIHKRRGDALNDETAKRSEYEEAMLAYHRAIEIYPGSPSIRTNLGALYRAMGNDDRAETEFRRVLDSKPTDPGANNNLGNILKARGELDSAIVYYERALGSDPDLPQANQNLGDLLFTQKQYSRASRHFLRALKARPDRPEIYWSLGRAYEAAAELGLAEESYRDAIRVAPSFPNAYFSLATMLYGLHRWQETIELFETFLTLWKGDPKFVTFAQGRIKASKDWLEKTNK